MRPSWLKGGRDFLTLQESLKQLCNANFSVGVWCYRALTDVALRIHIRTVVECSINTITDILKFLPPLLHPILDSRMFFLRLMPIFLKASLMFCCLTKSPHNPRHFPWRQISMLLHKLTKLYPNRWFYDHSLAGTSRPLYIPPFLVLGVRQRSQVFLIISSIRHTSIFPSPRLTASIAFLRRL